MSGSGLSSLAAAMESVVQDAPGVRVQADALIRAATAIDHSGPGSPDWRARVAGAIEELVAAGLVECPKTKAGWDRRTLPELPHWVRRSAPPVAAPRMTAKPWHHLLHWVPTVDSERRLSSAERGLLDAVNRWLPAADQAPVVPMRERSWGLLGDDKALEKLRSGRLFVPGRLTLELLRCRSTWPPVQQRVLGAGTWLIVENWSTFESLCTVAEADGFDGRIIFGSGNQVGTRLAALADKGDTPASPVLYFGDIDVGGIRAARLAVTTAQGAGWPAIRPCRPLYELALASPHRLRVQPASADTVSWTTAWIAGELGQQVAMCLTRGEAVRQEAVGLEILGPAPFAELVADV
ncbi:DUF2220 domain-containing protein [Frankia sp. Mgl5]|uniref:DUF2220 domain-containing protein n=1 Tax=Frankia sp. Mgl5 TaxID=2933793 RepID=UPI0020103BFA|nr:DUF2220 domain-containing protein [Frankia sp. Mgl5]MCK9926690.1 DUF2220 domain-containing protein [Frankia sp. Mgl5]